MKKILLVEDDTILGETIVDILEDKNYDVVWVKDGEKALDKSFCSKYDLYLLDVNVPFINGFELLKDLRQSADMTPAIFITALIDINSLEKGFDVGADDYIKKPFNEKELIIRINTQIKKSFNSYEDILKYKDLEYDISSKILRKNGKIVHLSPSESELLELFLKNQGKIISKDEILFTLKDGEIGSDASLRVQISKLKKIGLELSNIRAIGYRCEKL
jgi:DNA-binding response OmpR family regulator